MLQNDHPILNQHSSESFTWNMVLSYILLVANFVGPPSFILVEKIVFYIIYQSMGNLNSVLECFLLELNMNLLQIEIKKNIHSSLKFSYHYLYLENITLLTKSRHAPLKLLSIVDMIDLRSILLSTSTFSVSSGLKTGILHLYFWPNFDETVKKPEFWKQKFL